MSEDFKARAMPVWRVKTFFLRTIQHQKTLILHGIKFKHKHASDTDVFKFNFQEQQVELRSVLGVYAMSEAAAMLDKACVYPSSLVAQAEGADAPRLLPHALSLRVHRAEARLSVRAAVSNQEHVGQVGDVAGGEAQRLDLGQPPVHGLGGDESPESREGGVDALSPASLPGVGRAPLLHHHRGVPRLRPAGDPPAFLRGAAVALLRAAVALAAVLVVLLRGDGEVRVDQVRGHGPQHGKSHDTKRSTQVGLRTKAKRVRYVSMWRKVSNHLRL